MNRTAAANDSGFGYASVFCERARAGVDVAHRARAIRSRRIGRWWLRGVRRASFWRLPRSPQVVERDPRRRQPHDAAHDVPTDLQHVVDVRERKRRRVDRAVWRIRAGPEVERETEQRQRLELAAQAGGIRPRDTDSDEL